MIKVENRTIKRFLCELPPKAWLATSKSGGDQYAKVFKKEPDYIVVSMAAVLREFQGKGFMHKILEQPFAAGNFHGLAGSSAKERSR